VKRVDDPCYFNFHALLRAHRATIISVPYTPTGPDIALFSEALAVFCQIVSRDVV
jgi:DNA-binding transcriptional MocR family regulator